MAILRTYDQGSEICDHWHKGAGFNKAAYVAEVSMHIAASTESGGGGVDSGSFANSHGERADWALDAAEAMWKEFCKRFPDTRGDG